MSSINSYSPRPPAAPSRPGAAGIEAALGRATMSPEDIIAYVTAALTNIDGEFQYWKDEVEARQEKSRQVRELLNTIRSNTGPNGGTGAANFDNIQAALDAAKADPTLNTDPEVMETIAGLERNRAYGADGGRGIAPEPLAQAQRSLEEKLASLNSDNELVMMNLQKLMQQRNQVSQFSSNALNLLNETLKGVIGNLR